MYSDWVWPQLAYIIVVFLWLGILSFVVWKQKNFLQSLFPKSGERDIRKKFEEVIKSVSDFEKDLGEVKRKLSEVEEEGLRHVQKVALVRYNPYEDTGGDQSFSVVLLDDKGNGFVITSLHARSGTRVFAKPVIKGISSKYQFSKEEKQAIEKALKGISKT